MNRTIDRKCIPVFLFFAILLLQAGCSDISDSSTLLDEPETYATHIEEESSASTQSDDMSVQYPNAYRVFSELYGAYFYVDHGAFMLQWENSTAAIQLAPVDIQGIYEGTDLTAEVDSIGMNALGLYGLSYDIINHTEEEIGVYNEIPQQQIFLDGTWWNVDTNYWARNLSMYTSFEPGKNEFSENLQVIYSSDGLHPISEYPGARLPAGQYRLVIPLAPFDESNLIFEFEIS
jgi:hypothetical protein